MTKFIRRLQKIGSTILVSLPKEWVQANNLDKGIPVELETGHNTIVTKENVKEKIKLIQKIMKDAQLFPV